MSFMVACAQIAPAKAELEANLDKIADLIEQGSAEGASLIVFPEAATTGYFLEGGVAELALTQDELVAGLLSRLKGRLREPTDALVGFYQTELGNLYNAACYMELGPDGGRAVHTYRKFFLPTYGVFDEERFVSRGRDAGVFQSRLGRVGVLICEDVWHSVLPAIAAVRGAQLIIVPSASPARGFSGDQIGNLARYERLLTAVSEEHGVYCINAQLTGFEGGKGFVGGSMVVDPFGRLVAQGPVQEEHLLLAEINLELIEIARMQSPLLSDLQSAWGDVSRLFQESPPSG